MDTEDGMDMDVEARAQLQSVIDAIPPAARLEVARLSRDDLIWLHHGLGTLIRNRIRAGELGALFRWSHDQTDAEARSFDDLSWPILVATWAALRSSTKEDVSVSRAAADTDSVRHAVDQIQCAAQSHSKSSQRRYAGQSGVLTARPKPPKSSTLVRSTWDIKLGYKLPQN